MEMGRQSLGCVWEDVKLQHPRPVPERSNLENRYLEVCHLAVLSQSPGTDAHVVSSIGIPYKTRFKESSPSTSISSELSSIDLRSTTSPAIVP